MGAGLKGFPARHRTYDYKDSDSQLSLFQILISSCKNKVDVNHFAIWN